MVAVDVGADDGAGLLERLELFAPDAALLELCEPRLDERLGLGVAVAAARCAMPCSASRARNAREVNAVPVSVPSVSSAAPIRRSATAASMTAVASTVRHRMSSAQPTISRVQQSIAAFR